VVSAAGLVDVFLRFALTGWSGLWEAAFDPGKALFHVILLPFAVAVLLPAIPAQLVARVWQRHRVLLAGIAVAFFGLSVAFAWTDSKKGFCSRRPAPEDVADVTLRNHLVKTRDDWRATIAGLYRSPDVSAEKISNAGRASMQSYDGYVKNLRPDCRFPNQASIRAHWAPVLTWLAVIFVAGILWLLFVSLLAREPPGEDFLESLLVIVALLAPWLVLRPYSEWYTNFGSQSDYTALLPALLSFIVVLGLIKALKDKKTAITVLSTIFGTGSVILGVVMKSKPEWFERAAREITRLDAVELSMVYAVITVSVVGLVVYLVPDSVTSTEGEHP
jgi:hypothetical protein